MTIDNGTLEASDKNGVTAIVELKIPPDEMLAGNMVQYFLEAGYDVGVSRIFSDTFDPPKIDHFLLSLNAGINIEEETVVE